MTARSAMAMAVDTLDKSAGDVLELEARVRLDPMDYEHRAILASELGALRRRLMVVSQVLADARRQP